jgi:hypothetical protein
VHGAPERFDCPTSQREPGVSRRSRRHHVRDWRKHCAKYQACGQPVYFVQETWYHDVYLPRYRDHDDDRGARGGKGSGKDGGRGKGHGRD